MYNIPTRIFTDLYLKSKRQHFRVFVYKSNLYFFFHMKLQNFEFKKHINKKKNSGNVFVTISASARGICTRKCEQILCPCTFILFISTNGCLYNFFKSNLYFFLHMKLQNFEFKNYLNHYLKRSDHFLGTLKFLHTVSVSSSDSLVIGFRCMFYKWFYNYMYTCYLEIIKWTKILGQENKQDWIHFLFLDETIKVKGKLKSKFNQYFE
jgi:hypothetical protein